MSTFALTLTGTWQPGFTTNYEYLLIGPYKASADDEGGWSVEFEGDLIAEDVTQQRDMSSAKARAEQGIRGHAKVLGRSGGAA